MPNFEMIAYRSWYGPLRRPFRALSRLLIGGSPRIAMGPLKGLTFSGGELIYRLGVYELHIQYALEGMLRTGQIFYDIGANNGYLSLLGARCVGETGKVFAFEPLPENAARARALMEENQIGNYQLTPKAVASKPGVAEFYLGDDHNAHTPSLIRGRREHAITVDVTTLDQFAEDHPWPNLIKMDIEGAEVMALRGSTELLSSDHPPKWLIEVHSDDNEQDLREILLNHRYHVRELPSPFKHKPYPTHIMAWK